MNTLILRELTLTDAEAFYKALYIPSDSDVSLALGYKQEMTFVDYLVYLKKLKEGHNLPEGYVPSTLFFGFVDHKIVGRLSLRHRLNEHLESIGGHIGYLTLTPFRKQGYAGEMLRQSFSTCKTIGLKKVLITCDDDNVGSIAVIENNKGKPDPQNFKVQTEGKLKRRYWIQI